MEANSTDKKTTDGMTPRQIKIKQLREKLTRLSNQETTETRKQRNGQLIAAGVYVELAYKNADIDTRKELKEKVMKVLDGRNAECVSAMFKRLDENNQISVAPEPPKLRKRAKAVSAKVTKRLPASRPRARRSAAVAIA